MLRAIVLVVAATSSLISAEVTCRIPYEIMYGIAKNEHQPKRPVGYPYIISFNGSYHPEELLKEYDIEWLDKRTLDCIQQSECIKVAETLIEANITNIDLGAYQTNYYWHKHSISSYFSLEKSYRNACVFIERLVKSYGWSWDTLGRYHSSTDKYRISYANKLASNVNNILKGMQVKNIYKKGESFEN